MSHIFISYARKDIDCVRNIVKALEKSGFDVWIDLDEQRRSVDAGLVRAGRREGA